MMPRWVAGVDGCKAGWVVAFVEANHEDIRVRVMERFTDIFAAPEETCASSRANLVGFSD